MFGRAVHSLSKIGEELYFEPLDHGVSSSLAGTAAFDICGSFCGN